MMAASMIELLEREDRRRALRTVQSAIAKERGVRLIRLLFRSAVLRLML